MNSIFIGCSNEFLFHLSKWNVGYNSKKVCRAKSIFKFVKKNYDNEGREGEIFLCGCVDTLAKLGGEIYFFFFTCPSDNDLVDPEGGLYPRGVITANCTFSFLSLLGTCADVKSLRDNFMERPQLM